MGNKGSKNMACCGGDVRADGDDNRRMRRRKAPRRLETDQGSGGNVTGSTLEASGALNTFG